MEVKELNKVNADPASDPAYAITEAARYLGMSVPWLRLHRGEIAHYWMGRQLRFRRSDLDAYLAKARHEPQVKVS
jgi:excisionase family DNA binding protein